MDVGKQETLGFWSQSHFALIRRSLECFESMEVYECRATQTAGVRSETHWIGRSPSPGENCGKVIAHRDLQSKAAFDDREHSPQLSAPLVRCPCATNSFDQELPELLDVALERDGYS